MRYCISFHLLCIFSVYSVFFHLKFNFSLTWYVRLFNACMWCQPILNKKELELYLFGYYIQWIPLIHAQSSLTPADGSKAHLFTSGHLTISHRYHQNIIIGQWHDFCQACLFVAWVASFVPERSKGANDATRATNKQYAWQKSCDYYYHQYTRTNNTIFQHITKESTIISQPIMSRAANVFAARLLASFVEGSLLFGPVYWW